MVKTVTDANLKETLAAGKPVVLDFWATWCGPCRMVSPLVDELADEFDGQIIVGKVDVDDNDEAAAEYGIMSIPTILFFKNGELVNRHVGAAPKEVLRDLFKQLL
ncbi:MAG: thioredoxin [Paludibacteraceae bacterium]|nr:thioredoxin [Paludibacteraceae bacterium]